MFTSVNIVSLSICSLSLSDRSLSLACKVSDGQRAA